MIKLMNKSMLLMIVACVAAFLVCERNLYISLFDSPRANPYVYTANFIKTLSDSDSDSGAKRLRLVLFQKDGQLNNHPEISSMMGFMGGEGYIFQFLNSLNGRDFALISIPEYCQIDRKQVASDVYIISPMALSHTPKICLGYGVKILSTGYGLDASKDVIDSTFKHFPYELILSSEYENLKIPAENIFESKSGASVLIREWGASEQILILSKSPSISLKLKKLGEGRYFIFGHTPSYASNSIDNFLNPAPIVSFVSEMGSNSMLPLIGGRYFVPPDISEILVAFGKHNYSKHFNAYLFIMHDPKIRVIYPSHK